MDAGSGGGAGEARGSARRHYNQLGVRIKRRALTCIHDGADPIAGHLDREGQPVGGGRVSDVGLAQWRNTQGDRQQPDRPEVIHAFGMHAR